MWDSGDEDVIWDEVESVIWEDFILGGVIHKVTVENVELVVVDIMGLAKRLIEILGSQINFCDSIVKD